MNVIGQGQRTCTAVDATLIRREHHFAQANAPNTGLDQFTANNITIYLNILVHGNGLTITIFGSGVTVDRHTVVTLDGNNRIRIISLSTDIVHLSAITVNSHVE